MFNFLKFLIVFIQLQYILNEKFLSHEDCGKMKNPGPKGWITNIVLNDKNTTDIKCIANFITEEWLISTASCLRNYKNASYYKIKSPQTNVSLEVEKIVKSPKYNPTLGAGYDIALIKLKTAQQFESEQIHTGLSPICVPDWDDFKSKFTSDDGKECQLKNETNHNITIKVDFTNKNCSDRYKQRFDLTNMICVEVNDCNRTHGSPLMCYDSNDDKVQTDGSWKDRLYLTGIASWPLTGKECDPKPDVLTKPEAKLDVFTKLYSNDYTKWINKIIRPQQQLV